MLRTNLWTITMQNVSGIEKWNYEKLPLNFAMQFPFPFLVISGNNNVSFPFPKIGNRIFPFPFPKVGNEIFRSRSQSLGMGWAIPVPVPKCQKVIPAHPWLSSRFVEDTWYMIHSKKTTYCTHFDYSSAYSNSLSYGQSFCDRNEHGYMTRRLFLFELTHWRLFKVRIIPHMLDKYLFK